MTTSHICIMIAIIVYLGAMLYVGYLCSKKNNDTSDFYLGGRKLGPLVTAMSAEASDMSSWLLMGLPRTSLSFRNRRCRMDSYRPGDRNLSQLEDRSKKDSPLHTCIRQFYHTAILFQQPFPR